MRIQCGKCGQKYDASGRDQGKQIQCECGEMILVPFLENSPLFPCPDCANPVSKKAWFCPKCGTQINSQKSDKNEVVIKNIDLSLYDMAKLIICFVIAMFILSFLIGLIFLLIVALSGNLIK